MRRILGLLLVLAFAVPASAQEVLTVDTINTLPTTDLNISPTSGTVNIAGHLLPSLTDTYDIGSPNKLWNQGYLAQLNAILFALNTQTLMGGYSTWSVNAGGFAAAVASGDTTIDFGTTMTPGHFVLTRAHDTGGTITAEYFQVGSNVSGTTYNVTRNLSGLGAKNWAQGVPFVVLGTTGTARMDVLAYDGKPRLQIVEQGATYNAQTVRAVLGNLNGYYGYSSDLNGLVVGAASGARFMLDPTNGLRIFGGDNDEKVTIDTSGNATFDGRITVGTGRNQIRNADCTVSKDDWFVGDNISGLTTTLNGPWTSGSWGLGNINNDCYLGVSGTPGAGDISYMYGGGTQGGGGFFPVSAGSRYEASAYLGVHRSGNTYVQIQWFNIDGSTFISGDSGNNCTASSNGGTGLLADGASGTGYCRSGVVATAPTGAAYARFLVITTHTAELNPFIFVVHTYFGEASAGQEDLTEWGAAGITAINNGLIEAEAINTRTLAADSVTSAKIVAGTIVASDIASGTITADRLSVSTLSAITADLGTVTAGSISGVTASFGGTVTLNGSGLTIASGTGTGNKIKWSSGSEINDSGGSLFLASDDFFFTVGGGGQLNLAGGKLNVEQNMEVGTGVRLVTVGGNGATAFVCTDNDGDLYSSASTCDGSAPAPAALDVAALLDRVAVLEHEVSALRAATGVRQ